MKIGLVISTNEPEVVWNAFRFGVTALNANHKVKVFLINKGVEAEDIKDNQHNVMEQIDAFTKSKGQILACETCLKIRGRDKSSICQVSTMKELLKIVEESDKVLTFG
ncbi:MAG: DsrE family protein [Nanoarchaeota archaeon]